MKFKTAIFSSLVLSGIVLAATLSLLLPAVAAAPEPSATQIKEIQTHYPLATGNGYGFAVLAPSGEVTRFYAHPYRFEKPNEDQTKDGPDTTNFLKSMTWHGVTPLKDPKIGYVAESQIISAKYQVIPPVLTPGLKFSERDKAATVDDEDVYFLPFGLKRNVFVAAHRASSDKEKPVLSPVWLHKIEHEENKIVSGRKVRLLNFHDVKESLALVSLDPSASEIEKSTSLPGPAWAFIVLEDPSHLDKAVTEFVNWQGNSSIVELVAREVKNLDAWRVEPAVHFASEEEHKLWRQNETILRMSQIQEENTNSRFNHGMILASLPDGMWFTPWVRDMSYALAGLVRMGHKNEARDGILSWFNARPVGRWKQETRNVDYQISVVRYYGDGSEESDYSGQKTPNVEYDDWGLALWAISDYWQKTHDDSLLEEKTYRGDTVYESMRDYVVKPLLANLDKYQDGLIVAEDSSCWEEHQENKRHYADATIAAIPGLKGFLQIAAYKHDDDSVKLVGEKLKLLEQGFKSAFIKDGFVKGVVETDTQPKSELDGAVLEAFNFDIVNDAAIAEKTIEKLQKLKMPSGGYRRNTGPSNYEAHEFLFIDFNMARLLFKLGRTKEAANILEALVNRSCQDNGLIPEMFVSAKNKDWPGAIGDPAGSIPMVGFGAGDFAVTLADRERFSQVHK